jgi:hypothetical protein
VRHHDPARLIQHKVAVAGELGQPAEDGRDVTFQLLRKITRIRRVLADLRRGEYVDA